MRGASACLLLVAGCAGTEVQPVRRAARVERPREPKEEDVDRWLNRSLRKELARGGASWYGTPGVFVPWASSDALLWHVPFDQRYDARGGSAVDFLWLGLATASLLARPDELCDWTQRGRRPWIYKDLDEEEYLEMLRNVERRR